MSELPYKKEDVKGIEAKHITYVTDQDGKYHDAHFVKEIVHLKDGTAIPRLSMIEDYQRPFWITQKGRQNHKEKKDYEYEKYLTKYKSTQINLTRNIAKVLGDYSMGPNPRLRQLARSPYLYGADVSSSCCLKHGYQTRYPGLISRNTVAGGDIETNVYEADNDGQIICMSVTFQKRVYLAYLKRWVSDIKDPIGETHREMDSIPELRALIKDRELNIVVEVLDSPADIIIQCLRRLHEWKPDFFAFWNIDFDMSRILKTLDHYGIEPKDVFSDPSVPKNYRYFHYRRDQAQVTTASGVSKSKGPEDQWHWVTAPATFQCIDAMATYRNTRVAKGKDPSYALDRVLKKELNVHETMKLTDWGVLQKFEETRKKHANAVKGGYQQLFVSEKPVDYIDQSNTQLGDTLELKMEFGKLKFAEADHLTGIEWHKFMQTKHKIKYGLYNIIDSMRLEQLDEKTNDLARSISLFSKSSEYKNFNSNPRRLCDDMHFWYLKRPEPCVIGTSSDQMVHELDQYVVGHDSWINMSN